MNRNETTLIRQSYVSQNQSNENNNIYNALKDLTDNLNLTSLLSLKPGSVPLQLLQI